MHFRWTVFATRVAAGVALTACSTIAVAFGPDGHLIAGYLAEPRLCPEVREEIRAIDREVRDDLGDFPALGLWADRIRSDPAWQYSAPWHYMNVEREPTDIAAARAAIRAHQHPPEGDVLEAIERFSAELADRGRAARTRANALRFLVHFVVDIHQPLHVGSVSDRGGNEIDVVYGGESTNLHRFWDTDVIELRGLSARQYARGLAELAEPGSADADPITWAAESLLLRPRVYRGVAARAGVQTLSAAYLSEAQSITERRLAAAGTRLAQTLNRLLCPAR
jgi:hypothetical protein